MKPGFVSLSNEGLAECGANSGFLLLAYTKVSSISLIECSATDVSYINVPLSVH